MMSVVIVMMPVVNRLRECCWRRDVGRAAHWATPNLAVAVQVEAKLSFHQVDQKVHRELTANYYTPHIGKNSAPSPYT